MDRLHAHPAELLRDRRGEVAALAQRRDVLVRVAAVAVVLGGAGREVGGQPLREGDQAAPGLGAGVEFEVHGRQSVTTLTVTGTPRVMLSKTTERPWPRATISRSFSGGASPRTRKVIRMRSNPLR